MAMAEDCYETEGSHLIPFAEPNEIEREIISQALVPSTAPPAVDESIDLYEVLGLNKYDVWPESKSEQHRLIRASYLALARIYHPDKIGRMAPTDQAAALHYCQRLTVAYGVLCDADKKRSYDRQITSNSWRKMLKRDYWRQLKEDIWLGLTCEDPTWRRQMLISAVLVVGGMIVIGVSGGMAAPAVMIAVGAVGGTLAGAGQLTLFDNLKLKHRENDMQGLTTREYCRSAAIGAAIGAVAGGTGAWAQSAVAASSVFAETSAASIGGGNAVLILNNAAPHVGGMVTRNAVLSSLDVARDVRRNSTQMVSHEVPAKHQAAGRLQMIGTSLCKRYMLVEWDTFDLGFHRTWTSQHSNSACCELELGAQNITVTFSVMGGRTVRKVRRSVRKQPWCTPAQAECFTFRNGDNLDVFFHLRGTSLNSWCSGAYDFGQEEWAWQGESWWWDHDDPAMRPDQLGFKYLPVKWKAAGRLQMRNNHNCDRTMCVEYDVDFSGRHFHRNWDGDTSKPGVVCCNLEPRAHNVRVTFKTQPKSYRGMFMTQSRKDDNLVVGGARGKGEIQIGTGDGVDVFFNFQGRRFFAYDFGRAASEPAQGWEEWDHSDPTMRVDQLGFKHAPANWASFLESTKLWDKH